MSTERAKKFAESLRNAGNIPVDDGEMKLPEYADEERIRRAQISFKNHFFAIFYSMYLGLITILAIPSILKVLIHTQKSSSDVTAYKRYMQTIYHTLAWFRHDLKPGTRAWQSLQAVRNMHFHASQSANAAAKGIISQKDIAITQFGFMGYSILLKDKTGCFFSEQDIEDYCHYFRVLGHLIGLKDEYNLCCETMEETYERLEVIRNDFLKPALEQPPKEFAEMTRFVANGMWCFNPRDAYNVIIFTIKRFCGLENFYYTEEEIPKSYDRSKLEVYKLGYYDRFFNWLTCFIHEYLLQFFIFRAFFNAQTQFHEFLITYFPFLAIYSFGWKKAYDIKILTKKNI
ncbi:hypothetical protein PVAND_013137 [Polypedilum vanderplanki]|uniref:ER-bound oxygenase mpaB/mpaB'/Rubber oxygenase catalytic domain-containing protein n=1 Tax=Polypedilum vanderplanki TaxID=319348 RepID=A0A9J6CPQ4_POLVA|nr:hypothetical protein PVAND_013137 [Polypedilum vanderplanki]